MRGSGPARPRRFSPRTALRWLAPLSILAPALVASSPPVHAVQTRQNSIVSAVPASFTPWVNDGTVFAMAEVAGQIVLGGSFTNVSPAGDPGTVDNQPHALAFDATSGSIDTGFNPTVNGQVNSVAPGPKPDEVYVGGSFSQVDGSTMRVALLNVHTGGIVAGWHPPHMNGAVDKVLLAHGRLYVGGRFSSVGGKSRRGLATLNPSTGRVTSYLDLQLSGHHNYGTNCDPSKESCAKGVVGAKAFDVNPSGTRMVVIGNFTHMAGRPRDQVAMVDLNRSRAAVDKRWSTLAYTAACTPDSFDSYIRDVQFDPAGKYFVIAATGGVGHNRDHSYSS
jgi:hypothetical protein